MYKARHHARTMAVQLLYQSDVYGLELDQLDDIIGQWLDPEITLVLMEDLLDVSDIHDYCKNLITEQMKIDPQEFDFMELSEALDLRHLDFEHLRKMLDNWLDPETTKALVTDLRERVNTYKRLQELVALSCQVAYKSTPAPASLFEEHEPSDDEQSITQTREFAAELVRGTREHLPELDAMIEAKSEHWKIDRIFVVERNILRMALYELFYVPVTPPKVAINEAIELARELADEDAWSLINGILDSVHSER